MSAALHFIGDEAAAAGFRLAGFRVHACEPEAAEETLERVLAAGSADLVLLAGAHARRIGSERLDALSMACEPPVAVVAGATGQVAPADLARRVRSALGVGA